MASAVPSALGERCSGWPKVAPTLAGGRTGREAVLTVDRCAGYSPSAPTVSGNGSRSDKAAPMAFGTAAARRDLGSRPRPPTSPSVARTATTEASQIRLVLRRSSWNPRLEEIMNDHATRIEGAARPRLERRARASARGRGYVISVTLLAVIWSDALALALAGFLVANTVHAVNHVVDLDLGGRGSDPWLLGLVSVLIAVALALRLKEIGYVVGAVGTAATPKLEPFVRQKTALLVTYRRDGTPVGTPLSVAVDGDHAFFRSYERAWKTRRLRNRSDVELMPSTARGKPTGVAIHGRARRRMPWPASTRCCRVCWCRSCTGWRAPTAAGRSISSWSRSSADPALPLERGPQRSKVATIVPRPSVCPLWRLEDAAAYSHRRASAPPPARARVGAPG